MTVTDPSNESDSATAIVTVIDNIAPNITAEAQENCEIAITIPTPTVTDNCSELALGSSLNFDGINDIVEVGNTSTINTNDHTQRTIEVYFKVDNKNISTRKQVLWEEGAGGAGVNLYIFDGRLYMGIYSHYQAPASFVGNWIDTDAIKNGQWHNAVLVFDGNAPLNERLKGYLDGNLVGMKQLGTFSSAHGNSNAIGGLFNGSYFHDGIDDSRSGHFFKGDIDEVRVWTTARIS